MMKQVTEFQLEYVEVESDKPVVSAIVVAAGSGQRMGKDKQFLPLLGIPVLARTLLAFQSCDSVRDIVIVAKEEAIPDVERLIDTYAITKAVSVVAGGKERQDSVANGISALSDDTVYVAIHDGARPLITPEEISNVISVAGETGAAALAVPVKDTIKRVDNNRKIIETPIRSTLMAMQTPQVFNLQLYKKAMAIANSFGASVTDDCQIVEMSGHSVYTVEGSYRNIKLTTPEDVLFAELLLKGENI